uniref:Origin of replication complex subunit 4 n=1 Tax=Zea mays TaxID=4577 RepID=A0A804NF39_MAIZE
MVAAVSLPSQAQAVLRSRLCDPVFIHSALSSSLDTNYSKLKYLVASSVSEACNNSVLLLGPRGCGKAAVVDMVLDDLKEEHPDAISVEIARQLCLEHQLSFSKMASSDDNTEFMIDMLRECGLAHKTILFILEEFDLFAQGKQRLLYSLLDAMQSLTSQAVVIGVSCRLDADQLLEKRVRSRFSHRKLLFISPSLDDIQRLVEHLLILAKDSGLPSKYIADYNSRLTSIFSDKKFKGCLNSLMDADATTSNIQRFLFRAVSYMDMESGFLSVESFLKALSSMQRQPKMDSLQDLSILELYILVCMHRLESKEQTSYNFTSIMKDPYKTPIRLLINMQAPFVLGWRNQALEYRPVKLLISSRELAESLKLNTTCPAVLQKLFDRERYM